MLPASPVIQTSCRPHLGITEYYDDTDDAVNRNHVIFPFKGYVFLSFLFDAWFWVLMFIVNVVVVAAAVIFNVWLQFEKATSKSCKMNSIINLVLVNCMTNGKNLSPINQKRVWLECIRHRHRLLVSYFCCVLSFGFGPGPCDSCMRLGIGYLESDFYYFSLYYVLNEI